MNGTSPIFTRYAPLWRSWHALADDAWLTADECGERARLRDASRRAQWGLARWLSKRMIGDVTGLSPREIEILSHHDGLGHRPRIRLNGCLAPWSLSIAHTRRGALIGLSLCDQISVGVDLACDVPQDDSFFSTWFTEGERRWLRSAPSERAATLWALKEAAFKACNSGEQWSPRHIEIVPTANEAFQCRYAGRLVCPERIDIRQIDGHTAVTVCVRRAHESRDASHPASLTICL